MRFVMPCEKGVSTMQCMCGNSAFMSRATLNASLSALPGMQITRSICMVRSTSRASSVVLTCVNVGG